MKMILFVYNAPLEEEIMAGLGAANIHYYTKWEKVLGTGKSSDPRMDTNVWPGYNSALLIYCEDQQLANIKETLKNMKKKLPKGSVSAYVWPLEEVI
jgi:hypothetical protein